MPADSSNFVSSLEKGLAVISCFGAETPRMTITEVAGRIGATRATARRFLLTLVELGYAVSDGKHFELTPKVLGLGHAYLSTLSYWDSARTVLAQVTNKTHESCSIGVLDSDEVVYVARSAAPHRIMSVSLAVGSRLPAHATSMGQVLLAHAPKRDVDALLSRRPLRAFTEHTLTSPQALRNRLCVIQNQGYALVAGELEAGLISLAVPLFDPSGEIVAAMNISAHSARLTPDGMIAQYLPELQAAAKRIEASVP